MQLEEHASKKPFSVEFDHNPDADYWEGEEFFATADEAQKAAEAKAKEFNAVTISEIGTYENKKHKIKVEWMYYWWSSSTDEDERPVGRGTGYPGWSGNMVFYTPYSK